MRATHLCLTLCDPMDCSPSGCSVHWIVQVRTLAWAAFPFPRGSSWPRAWTLHCRQICTAWATGKHSRAQESYTNAAQLPLCICWFRVSGWASGSFGYCVPLLPFFLSRFLPSLWNDEILPHRKLSDDRSSGFRCCFHGTSRMWRSGLAGSSRSHLCRVSGWVKVWIKPKRKQGGP